MKRVYKIFEYLYLIIGVILTEETIRTWGENKSQTFLYIAISVMAFLMYFFKRWYRRKLDRENPE